MQNRNNALLIVPVCITCVYVCLQFPPGHGYPQEFVDVVVDCLKGDPSLRPTMPEVLRRLGALVLQATLQLVLPGEHHYMALCSGSRCGASFHGAVGCCVLSVVTFMAIDFKHAGNVSAGTSTTEHPEPNCCRIGTMHPCPHLYPSVSVQQYGASYFDMGLLNY